MRRATAVLLILTTSTIAAGDSAIAAAQHSGDSAPASVAEEAYAVIASGESDDKIVEALRHVHGGVGVEFLVQRYVNDDSIDPSLRRTLLTLLHAEVRESRQLESGTVAAVVQFAQTTDSSFDVSVAGIVLKASGTAVPWSIRIRQKDLQWQFLGWGGLLSLLVGVGAGLYVLVLVALPGRSSGLRGAQRAYGFALWLILSLFFTGAVLLSLLQSIGHNSTPPPGNALPYYATTMVLAVCLLILAIVLRRQRSP